MWVLDLENAPEKLRGLLSRWGVEVRAGLFVGSSSGKAREGLWATVCSLARPETSAVLVYDSAGPQGFEARTLGPHRREVVDVDGLWLVRFHPRPGDAAEPPAESLAPGALDFDPAEFDPEYLAP